MHRRRTSRGVYIGALYYFMVGYDLDGCIDLGSTTQIEALDRLPTPIAHVTEFFHRSIKRGKPFQANLLHKRNGHQARRRYCADLGVAI